MQRCHPGGMPQHCTVCARPDVREVNDALIRGRSRRQVAREYGIHSSTLDRHWWRCIPEDVQDAVSAGETEGIDVLDGRSLLAAMEHVVHAAVGLFERLEAEMRDDSKQVDRRAIVASLREVRASIESTAKLSFAVQDRPAPVQESDRPELDAAIFNALRARDVAVEAASPSSVVVERGLALPAAPSAGA